MKMINAVLMIVGLLASGSCFAESVIPVNFVGQPVLNLEKGSIQSCGIHFVGVETAINPSNAKEKLWVSDASFMLDRSGYGFVKALIHKTTVGDVSAGKKSDALEFKTFWMKAPKEVATNPTNGKIFDGEIKPSKLYTTTGESVLNLYVAIVEKNPILIGFKFAGGLDDIALSGLVNISDEEFKQVASCMDELIGKIQDDSAKLNSK